MKITYRIAPDKRNILGRYACGELEEDFDGRLCFDGKEFQGRIKIWCEPDGEISVLFDSQMNKEYRKLLSSAKRFQSGQDLPILKGVTKDGVSLNISFCVRRFWEGKSHAELTGIVDQIEFKAPPETPGLDEFSDHCLLTTYLPVDIELREFGLLSTKAKLKAQNSDGSFSDLGGKTERNRIQIDYERKPLSFRLEVQQASDTAELTIRSRSKDYLPTSAMIYRALSGFEFLMGRRLRRIGHTLSVRSGQMGIALPSNNEDLSLSRTPLPSLGERLTLKASTKSAASSSEDHKLVFRYWVDSDSAVERLYPYYRLLLNSGGAPLQVRALVLCTSLEGLSEKVYSNAAKRGSKLSGEKLIKAAAESLGIGCDETLSWRNLRHALAHGRELELEKGRVHPRTNAQKFEDINAEYERVLSLFYRFCLVLIGYTGYQWTPDGPKIVKETQAG